ncbi:hypothetical protein [Streptomyces sp. RerS4]|uniref:hypothetical protein n=1 Tax=Streptomyces sp. RerS4 TaxID=2942449 RepID=UPI00201B9FD4|nr:hypothetical protein [Streptomyces sp. RerS4]UQX02718.1 hypothetical protein M4D82_21175 [Streptomyces sp. RerS4]
MSARKWQGWLVGLMVLAGLMVFAPLGLYVWAGGGGEAAAPQPPPPEVRVTACRIDPVSRRVLATVEARGQGSYVVTVEFRDEERPGPGARAAQALVRVPGLTPGIAERAEAVGPVWPPNTTPWCGVADVGAQATPSPTGPSSSG